MPTSKAKLLLFLFASSDQTPFSSFPSFFPSVVLLLANFRESSSSTRRISVGIRYKSILRGNKLFKIEGGKRWINLTRQKIPSLLRAFGKNGWKQKGKRKRKTRLRPLFHILLCGPTHFHCWKSLFTASKNMWEKWWTLKIDPRGETIFSKLKLMQIE